MSKSEWKKFEDNAFRVVKKMHNKTKTTQNARIRGQFSETLREIDIKVDEFDWIAYEVKNHKQAIGSPAMEGFIKKLEDVKANKGAYISNSPFSKGALNYAKSHNVEVFHLVDTANEKIRASVAGIFLAHSLDITAARFGVSVKTLEYFELDQDLAKLLLLNSDGRSVSLYSLFKEFWNNGEIEVNRPGTYKYTWQNQLVRTKDGKEIVFDEVYAIYKVEEVYKKGHVPIVRGQGLFNVKDGSFRVTSKELLFEKISVMDISGWDEIGEETAHAIQPTAMMEIRGILPDTIEMPKDS